FLVAAPRDISTNSRCPNETNNQPLLTTILRFAVGLQSFRGAFSFLAGFLFHSFRSRCCCTNGCHDLRNYVVNNLVARVINLGRNDVSACSILGAATVTLFLHAFFARGTAQSLACSTLGPAQSTACSTFGPAQSTACSTRGPAQSLACSANSPARFEGSVISAPLQSRSCRIAA